MLFWGQWLLYQERSQERATVRLPPHGATCLSAHLDAAAVVISPWSRGAGSQ